jgi:hypothetical protein
MTTTRDDLVALMRDGTKYRQKRGRRVGGAAMSTTVSTELKAKAVDLALRGHSYRTIGEVLGVAESTVRRMPDVREARIAAEPNAHSTTRKTATVACRVQPATELISRVEWTLASLLGSDYDLCARDRHRLESILRAAQEGLDK